MSADFMTEAEIEKSLEKKKVTLLDKNEKPHVIEATRLTWYWFMIISTSYPYDPKEIVSEVIDWQLEDHPSENLGYLFEAYIASILKESGDQLCDFMVEEFRKVEMTDHLLYQQPEAFAKIVRYSNI